VRLKNPANIQKTKQT